MEKRRGGWQEMCGKEMNTFLVCGAVSRHAGTIRMIARAMVYVMAVAVSGWETDWLAGDVWSSV